MYVSRTLPNVSNCRLEFPGCDLRHLYRKADAIIVSSHKVDFLARIIKETKLSIASKAK